MERRVPCLRCGRRLSPSSTPGRGRHWRHLTCRSVTYLGVEGRVSSQAGSFFLCGLSQGCPWIPARELSWASPTWSWLEHTCSSMPHQPAGLGPFVSCTQLELPMGDPELCSGKETHEAFCMCVSGRERKSILAPWVPTPLPASCAAQRSLSVHCEDRFGPRLQSDFQILTWKVLEVFVWGPNRS